MNLFHHSNSCVGQTTKMAEIVNERNGRKHKVMFFLDSRGSGFERIIKEEYGQVPQFEMWFLGGTKIEDLESMLNYGKSNPHNIFFIMGGINNVTVKD